MTYENQGYYGVGVDVQFQSLRDNNGAITTPESLNSANQTLRDMRRIEEHFENAMKSIQRPRRVDKFADRQHVRDELKNAEARKPSDAVILAMKEVTQIASNVAQAN